MDKGMLGGEVALCSERGIAIEGQTLVPDEAKGYLEFSISHAFPVVTRNGHALHAGTIWNSYRSLRHTMLNLEHLVRVHDKEAIARDRILGAVVGVEMLRGDGQAMAGAARTPRAGEAPPYLRAVAAWWKQADGMDRVAGSHLAGRKKWSVSMEVDYTLAESGFAVEGEVEEFAGKTPADIREAGWSYCPCGEAPEDLLAVYDRKNGGTVTKAWKGRRVALLMNGIDGTAQYGGVAVVGVAAEREAEILRMSASEAGSAAEAAGWDAMTALLEGWKKNFEDFDKKVLTPGGLGV